MSTVIICSFCIVAVLCCKAIEKSSYEIKTVVVLATAVVILVSSLSFFTDVVSTVSSLISSADIDEMYVKIIFKGLGICYLTQFASDYSKDCGENAIASQVLLAGKISMLVITLPLMKAFAEIVKTLIV